ncbi:HNH endonuclease signature motif containing protein [Leifsonia sp. Leaf264]|uniref:HNH endonuclease signature motif containing protein n=1 Tax=Leifsonia sp. Leaf264 TaxID=1736314 RepID=UPI000700825D|nr:HNH endonuclease signature motif containing protein [Leifsonia sp. Leaf264]KQO97046.1 hypothetical protein ASF30_18545 [Leifsonia sp. Leaf264]
MESLRTRIEEAAAHTAALLGEASAMLGSGAASERDMIGLLAAAEDMGRASDALRVVAAGAVGDGSRPGLGTDSLAGRCGAASATELIERVARVSAETARDRIRLGRRLHPRGSLGGEILPAEFESVRVAFDTGRLGVDHAQIITGMLAKASIGVPTDMLENVRRAEHELVCAALGEPAEPGGAAPPPATVFETKDYAAVWAAVLDPDGAEPRFRDVESRGVRLHPARDGLIPISGLLLPEVAGLVRRVTESMTNPRQSLRFRPENPTDGEGAAGSGADPEDRGSELPRDPRTRAQRLHDAFAAVFDLAGRSGELPTLGGASPTIIVTVLDHDYASGHGVGHMDGVDEPVPMSVVKQHACANGVQPITLGTSGRIHRIGTTERTFNRAQRRALAARDGGCIICGLAAVYTEAHHVIPWELERRTHVDNGVLLCWYHHRTIETRDGWKVRMVCGSPQVMPPPELGPPVWRPALQSRIRASAQLTRRLRE